MATSTVEEAIMALADLGVTGSIDIAAAHDPDLILGWCRWAAERRQHGQQVGTGLIVSGIRRGEQPPGSGHTSPSSKRAERQARFEEYAQRFPAGSITESHRELQQRRWRDDGEEACGGYLVVVRTSYPTIEARCSACAFEVAYPLRALGVLPPEPAQTGCPEPRRPWREGRSILHIAGRLGGLRQVKAAIEALQAEIDKRQTRRVDRP